MAIEFSATARRLGIFSAVGVIVLGVAYAITLTVGFLSLKSPQQPIGDPMFSILEVLIIVMMPAMVALMVAVHAWAPSYAKTLSLIAVVFMGLLAGVTCTVHFVILTLSRQAAFAGQPWLPLFLSFRWPSVVYALDILGWDFFFPLSMFFAAPVFRESAHGIDPHTNDRKRGARARRFGRCCDRRHATAEHRYRRLPGGVSGRGVLVGGLVLSSQTVGGNGKPDGR